MRIVKIVFILSVIILLLGACASTTEVFKPLDQKIFAENTNLNYELLKIDSDNTNVPRHFMEAVNSYLEVALKESGFIRKGDKNYRIKIKVEKYKMRKGFIKKHLGFLAGGDKIVSEITVIDKRTGKIVGEAMVDTSNIAKSTTIDDMANMHAKKIAAYLKGGK